MHIDLHIDFSFVPFTATIDNVSKWFLMKWQSMIFIRCSVKSVKRLQRYGFRKSGGHPATRRHGPWQQHPSSPEGWGVKGWRGKDLYRYEGWGLVTISKCCLNCIWIPIKRKDGLMAMLFYNRNLHTWTNSLLWKWWAKWGCCSSHPPSPQCELIWQQWSISNGPLIPA